MFKVKMAMIFAVICLATAYHGFAEDLSRGDVQGPYSYEEISKKDHSGVTLHLITHEKPNLGGPVEQHARQFEELTGAKIVVEFSAFRDLYPRLMRGLKQKKYDIVFCGRAWFADILSFLEPLPEKMLNSPVHKDISEPYRRLGKWNGVSYLVEIDGDRHYLQYRKDLLENPAYKTEFRAKYHRELVPPRTWKEYAEIAGFLHGRKLDNGKMIYGSSEITAKNDLVYSTFIKRAAAYAKHPNVRGGFYFDLKTMKPLINTPGFVEALRDMVEMRKYFPPGGDNFSLVDALISFGTGQTVFSDMWGDAFIKAVESASPIRNKVAAELSPGSKRVWNRNTGKWDEFPDINYVPYLPSSWTSAVTKNCKHKNAAYDFLGFYRNRKNHASDMAIGEYGMNAFLNTDYDKVFWTQQAGWDDEVAASYVRMLRKYSKHPRHVFSMSVIQQRQYNLALNIGITRAMTGRTSPQQALDEVARKWERLTRRIGVDKQREVYANMVKLEDHEY